VDAAVHVDRRKFNTAPRALAIYPMLDWYPDLTKAYCPESLLPHSPPLGLGSSDE